MATFPLSYILIPFGLVFLLALTFYFFNIFHLRRYAIQSTATTMVMVAYTLGFLAIIAVVSSYMLTVDWNERFKLSDLIPEFQASSRL